MYTHAEYIVHAAMAVVQQADNGPTDDITEYDSDSTTINDDYDIYSDAEHDEEETQFRSDGYASPPLPTAINDNDSRTSEQIQQIRQADRRPTTSVVASDQSGVRAERADQSESIGVELEEETQLYSSQPTREVLIGHRRTNILMMTHGDRPSTSVVASAQSGVTNERTSQSGATNAGSNQSSRPREGTHQSENRVGVSQSSSGRHADEVDSQSLLFDLPRRISPSQSAPLPGYNANYLGITNSQSLQRTSLPIVQDIQLEQTQPPVNQSQPAEVLNGNPLANQHQRIMKKPPR